MNAHLQNSCLKAITTIAILPLGCWHGAATAQTQDGPAQNQGLEASPGPEGGGDHIMIGIGAAYLPAHHGADEYRFQPLPAVDVKWNRFFVNFQDGIGANLIDSEHVTIGAGLVPVDGYRSKDVPDGVGKLSMGLGGRGFVKLKQAGFEGAIGVTKVITGNTEGMTADASLSYPIMVNERLMLMPSIGTTWADKKHSNRYFGITAEQSQASGLFRFRVGSGFIDAKAELGAHYRLSRRVTLGAIGGFTTLFGDVKESPIVERKTRPFGILFVGYGF